MLARSSLALVVTLGVSGCASSSYRVADSPRVSMVYDRGTSVVYKNGKRYPDILEAVTDNPRALEEARTAQSLGTWGAGFYLGGTALIIAGGTMVAVGTNDDDRVDKVLVVTGAGLLTGALVAYVVSTIMADDARAHALDAINIYNDDVEAKMFLRRPAPAPTGPPATPTPAPR
jgi:hypothetical protein